MCVEGVLGERVGPFYQGEAAGGNDDVVIPAHCADAAIANLHIEGVRYLDGEAYCAAMAAAFMCVQLCGHRMQFVAILCRSQCWASISGRIEALYSVTTPVPETATIIMEPDWPMT